VPQDSGSKATDDSDGAGGLDRRRALAVLAILRGAKERIDAQQRQPAPVLELSDLSDASGDKAGDDRGIYGESARKVCPWQSLGMSGAVARDGEPVLTRGPSRGSVKQPNEYKIHTTPVPDEAHGVDWLGFFNSQLECWPEDEPQLIEKVDAAIESANQRLRDIYS
jgi:hypothetical protein